MSELYDWRAHDLGDARTEDPIPDVHNSPVAEPVRDAKVRLANALAYREQVEAAYAANTREQPESHETHPESQATSGPAGYWWRRAWRNR